MIFQQCVFRIFNKPCFSFSGLYTGSAGVAYMLHKVVKSNLFPDHNERFLEAADSYLETVFLDNNMR